MAAKLFSDSEIIFCCFVQWRIAVQVIKKMDTTSLNPILEAVLLLCKSDPSHLPVLWQSDDAVAVCVVHVEQNWEDKQSILTAALFSHILTRKVLMVQRWDQLKQTTIPPQIMTYRFYLQRWLPDVVKY